MRSERESAAHLAAAAAAAAVERRAGRQAAGHHQRAGKVGKGQHLDLAGALVHLEPPGRATRARRQRLALHSPQPRATRARARAHTQARLRVASRVNAGGSGAALALGRPAPCVSGFTSGAAIRSKQMMGVAPGPHLARRQLSHDDVGVGVAGACRVQHKRDVGCDQLLQARGKGARESKRTHAWRCAAFARTPGSLTAWDRGRDMLVCCGAQAPASCRRTGPS